MKARAICVCRDAGVCGVVGTALASRGVTVDHVAEIPSDADDVALFIVDRASRQAAGDRLRDVAAPVVVVGDDLDDDGLITLMLEAPVSHALCNADGHELAITSEKLVSGDVFGVEKYLAPGTQIAQRAVATDVEKRSAMLEVTSWAESIGARRPLVHRLAAVIDELLMNALHDAPRGSQPSLDGEPVDRRAVLRWAHDDRSVAVSVADTFGALRQRDVIHNVLRARGDRGRPKPSSDAPGAGLGLYLVLANVASLIVNVHPGRHTEVVCLFDLPQVSSRAVVSGVRSLHVFRGQAR